MRISDWSSDVCASDLSGSVSDVASSDAPVEQRRDSRSYSVPVGARGDLTSVIFGEIGVGYQARHYKSARYRDFEGATFSADVRLYVTRLMKDRKSVVMGKRVSVIV